MRNTGTSECTVCGGKEVYVTNTGANGGHGPALLPGLGRLFRPAKIDVHVCASCGHLSIFADGETLSRLRGNGRWKKAR